MPSEVLTPIILGLAIIAAVVVVVLLCKKFIKAVLGLILLVAILLGAYLGIRAIDNKTNIRHNVPAVDAAFLEVEEERSSYDIKNIQCNHLGTDIGITVVYDINSASNELLTKALLEDTRNVLLDAQRYAAICGLTKDGAEPKKIRVGLKYKGLDIQYYEAERNDQNDLANPNAMYGDFSLVLETGK